MVKGQIQNFIRNLNNYKELQELQDKQPYSIINNKRKPKSKPIE